MVRYTHDKLIEKLLSDPENIKEYEKLDEEFSLFEEMLKARLKAGKTQEEVAQALNTNKSAISRLERSGGSKSHSPTIATLRKYAKALNCDLKIQFIQHRN